MEDRKLQLDLFWCQAFPLIQAVFYALEVNPQAVGTKEMAQDIRRLWQQCRECLQMRLAPIADDLSYAAAAWVDEMILANTANIFPEWHIAPLQLFYCDDLNAGVRFFDLYSKISNGSLGAIKTWWFQLWLGLGFRGASDKQPTEIFSRNQPIIIDSQVVAKRKNTSSLFDFFGCYRYQIIFCCCMLVAMSVFLRCLRL